LSQLMMWGVIYSEGSSAGFSMEFIGDMQDSLILSSTKGPLKAGSRGNPLISSDSTRMVITRPGAGVN